MGYVNTRLQVSDGARTYADGIVGKKKIDQKCLADQFGRLLGKLVQVPKPEMQAE
jgi:hypothetical protein